MAQINTEDKNNGERVFFLIIINIASLTLAEK